MARGGHGGHVGKKGLGGVLLLAGILAGGEAALPVPAPAGSDPRLAIMNSICREPPASAGQAEEQAP